jgi:hypothetical protein
MCRGRVISVMVVPALEIPDGRAYVALHSVPGPSISRGARWRDDAGNQEMTP